MVNWYGSPRKLRQGHDSEWDRHRSVFREIYPSVQVLILQHWNHLFTQQQARHGRQILCLALVYPRHEACTYKKNLGKKKKDLLLDEKNLKMVRRRHNWFCEHYCSCTKNIKLEDQLGTEVHFLEKRNKEKEKGERRKWLLDKWKNC